MYRMKLQEAALKTKKAHLAVAGLVVAGSVILGSIGVVGVGAQEAPTEKTPTEQGTMRQRPVDGTGKRLGGMMRGGSIHGAAAEVIGITKEELHTEMEAGQTLAQVGEAHGIFRDALKEGITEKVTEKLTLAVTEGKITEAQKTEMLAALGARIDTALDATHTAHEHGIRPEGAPPAGMERGHRGGGPRGGMPGMAPEGTTTP